MMLNSAMLHITPSASMLPATPKWYSNDGEPQPQKFLFWIEVGARLPGLLKRLSHDWIKSAGTRIEEGITYQLLVCENYQASMMCCAVLPQEGYSWGGPCPYEFASCH